MIKLKLLWIFSFISLSFLVQAQQNNIWYFGSLAGLNFNTTPPTPLSNSAMLASEGCSSITDDNGQLLFYSNGVTIYNRQHQVMVNGDNLNGHISSFQGCIIIPRPGSDSLFYLFTTDAIENQFANGYTYSIIDMSLDNGRGAVIQKNTVLWPDCTERMTAVRHENGVDVWLITNDPFSNTFRSWLINCNGLQPNPVVSSTGEVLNNDVLNKVGMMKISPDSRTLCQTHFSADDFFLEHFFQLFDFDNSTGVISNARRVGYPNAVFISGEFSPDSRLLYISRPQESKIEQFDLTSPDISSMIASRVTINNAPGFYGMQLGPDQKIYLARPGNTLGVINNPNIRGLGCNFIFNQQTLDGGSKLGLPLFINDLSFDPRNGFTYVIPDSCAGTVQFTGETNLGGTIRWEWDFGDGNTSNLQNPVHTFNPADQTYTVKLKITSTLSCVSRVINKSQDIRPKGQFGNVEFTAVYHCDSGYVRFTNLSDDLTSNFIWDFDDGSFSNDLHPIHPYANSRSYNVKLKLNTALACLADSITHPIDVTTFSVQTIPTQTILIGQPVFLNVTGNGNSYLWSPGEWLSDSTIKNPIATPLRDITYKVTVTNAAGCIAEDSVFIKVIAIDGIYMPTGFTPNNDGKNDIIRPGYGEKFILKEFSVYNRWGQKLFSTNQRSAGWNGKVNGLIQDTGVYVWVITAVDRLTHVEYNRKGVFVLIR